MILFNSPLKETIKLFFFCLLFHTGSFLYGQHNSTDQPNDQLLTLIKEKNTPPTHSYHLLNGRKHTFIYPSARGNPYFNDLNWQNGIVKANGFTFDSVIIAYEILNDVLLMNHFSKDGSVIIALNAENIREFSIKDKSFINFSLIYPDIATGGVYYEQLYQEKSGIYVKYSKTISSGSNAANEYRSRETLYLLNNNLLIPIKNKRKIYKALSDKKKELKQYARENLPYFSIKNHTQVIDLIKHYDELN